ncbi:hypothetical protein [Nitrincola iocasae]|jgi:hypothetical protein|uniref:Lipoprotein n=1 Tax=Nitrincola iocasae TaxID=2614693 RepID=A0A5J6LGF6_9GAMM|nr:hypothetical protein [Nitrincola iocasae]QEW07720.1 hypothetical protein F5I99_15150 [Nitrincola iocasae]
MPYKIAITLSMTLMLGSLLSGCIKTDTLLQRDPTADQYYILDSRDLRLCRGETSDCYDLTPVASARIQLRPMEVKYGQRVNGPNYPVNFARMLINPPAGSYSVEQLEGGRFYRLPVNDYTDTAWRSIEDVFSAFYDN